MLKKTTTYLSILFITIGAVFMANGLILAWSPPGASPTGGNVDAPLNVGSTGQSKSGGLILNTGGASIGLIVDEGKVGIGDTTPDSGLKLDVEGRVGASEYCDQNGNNCTAAGDLGGGGGGGLTNCAWTGYTGCMWNCAVSCPAGKQPLNGAINNCAGGASADDVVTSRPTASGWAFGGSYAQCRVLCCDPF